MRQSEDAMLVLPQAGVDLAMIYAGIHLAGNMNGI